MQIINCQGDAKAPTASTVSPASTMWEVCQPHILVFGREMQERTSGQTITIVGCGGLGILIAELTMRLYPAKVTLIDYDHVSVSNLNRLTGATFQDAEAKTPKVAVAERLIHTFNPDQRIHVINGNFLDRETQEQCKEGDCDVLFCAADSVSARLAANRYCLALGIPELDLGVGAMVENGRLHRAGGQVLRILPESGFCLACSGLVDVELAARDLMSKGELECQQEADYIRNANIAQPQVYALNMMAASWAVWIYMKMIAGEELGFDGLAVDAQNFRAHTWTEQRRTPNNCPVCGDRGSVFTGERAELLVREPR